MRSGRVWDGWDKVLMGLVAAIAFVAPIVYAFQTTQPDPPSIEVIEAAAHNAKHSVDVLAAEAKLLAEQVGGLKAEWEQLKASTELLGQSYAQCQLELGSLTVPKIPMRSPTKVRYVLNGYPLLLETRPLAWFPPDPADVWVLDYGWLAGRGGNFTQAKTWVTTGALQLLARGWTLGIGLSATNVGLVADREKYPTEFVPLESWQDIEPAISGTWPGVPTRKIIDINDNATAQTQARLIALRAATKLLCFLDNLPPHVSSGPGPPWAVTCRFIKYITRELDRVGVRGFLNVPVHVGELTPAEMDQFTDALGDHALVVELSTLISMKQAAGYMRILDHGNTVIIVEHRRPAEPDAIWQMRMQQIDTWLDGFKRPGDRLHLLWPFNQAPPTWTLN